MGLSGAVCGRAVLALAIRVLHGLVRSLLRRGASLRVRPVRGDRSSVKSHSGSRSSSGAALQGSSGFGLAPCKQCRVFFELGTKSVPLRRSQR
jgi:hypothetical protein